MVSRVHDDTIPGARIETERAFFAPARPQHFSKRRPWFGYKPSLDDLESGNLIISQEKSGNFSWTYYGNLFDVDSEIKVRPCFLTNQEALQIVRSKALYISETDPRLSDYGLISIIKRPRIKVSDESDVLDLVSMHLASCRQVNIFKKDSNGKKFIDDRSTEDYWRAKIDVKNNPSDTDNLIRFCNRQGPSGEGPSCLSRRVCHGTTRTSPTPSPTTSLSASLCTSPSLSRTTSLSLELKALATFSAQDRLNLEACFEDDNIGIPYLHAYAHLQPQGYGPVQDQGYEEEDKRHSLKYRLMKLARMPEEKLVKEQSKYELKRARSEKRPETRVVLGDTNQTALLGMLRKRVMMLWVSRGKKSVARTQEEEEAEGGTEDINLLSLPALVVRPEGGAGAGWVETREMPGTVAGEGEGEGHTYRPKHDSLVEGIADGVSTGEKEREGERACYGGSEWWKETVG